MPWAGQVIAARGSGARLGDLLGHGLGLLNPRAPPAPPPTLWVPEGAVVTIEPGVDSPAWGGIRLEDDL